MTVTITLVVGASILLALVGIGGLLRTVVRHHPDKERQWRRIVPYIEIGIGIVMAVSGWFMRTITIVPALINISAGALFLGYGVYSAVRQRGVR